MIEKRLFAELAKMAVNHADYSDHASFAAQSTSGRFFIDKDVMTAANNNTAELTQDEKNFKVCDAFRVTGNGIFGYAVEETIAPQQDIRAGFKNESATIARSIRMLDMVIEQGHAKGGQVNFEP